MTPHTDYLVGIGLGLMGLGVLLIYLFLCFEEWRVTRGSRRWRREMR